MKIEVITHLSWKLFNVSKTDLFDFGSKRLKSNLKFMPKIWKKHILFETGKNNSRAAKKLTQTAHTMTDRSSYKVSLLRVTGPALIDV